MSSGWVSFWWITPARVDVTMERPSAPPLGMKVSWSQPSRAPALSRSASSAARSMT